MWEDKFGKTHEITTLMTIFLIFSKLDNTNNKKSFILLYGVGNKVLYTTVYNILLYNIL